MGQNREPGHDKRPQRPSQGEGPVVVDPTTEGGLGQDSVSAPKDAPGPDDDSRSHIVPDNGSGS